MAIVMNGEYEGHPATIVLDLRTNQKGGVNGEIRLTIPDYHLEIISPCFFMSASLHHCASALAMFPDSLPKTVGLCNGGETHELYFKPSDDEPGTVVVGLRLEWTTVRVNPDFGFFPAVFPDGHITSPSGGVLIVFVGLRLTTAGLKNFLADLKAFIEQER